MEQKRGKRTGIMTIILLAVAAVLVLTAIFMIKSRRQDARYYRLSDRESYGLCLYGDGTFGFYDLASSTLTEEEKRNRYYWSDGMLVLDFADSDRKLYFEPVEEDLVYRESVSVPLENDPLTDGAVFSKVAEQPGMEEASAEQSGMEEPGAEQSGMEPLATAESEEEEFLYNDLGQLGEEGYHYSSEYPEGEEVLIYETTADITHDGIADRILVAGYSIEENPGVEDVLSISSEGCYLKLYRGLQDGSFEATPRFISRNFHAAHTGNGTICLTHSGGEDYLLFSSTYEMQGIANYGFWVIYVDDEKGIVVVDSNEVEFIFASMEIDDSAVRREDVIPGFREKISPYLENAALLLSLDVESEAYYSTEQEECPASAFFDTVWSRTDD